MLSKKSPSQVNVFPITVDEARHAINSQEWESCVGHVDTARVFSKELGVEIPFRRSTITLFPGATVLVGQYDGPRLTEGATSLPEGGSIQWMMVEVLDLVHNGLVTLIDPQACPYCGFRDCGMTKGGTSCAG